jgi:hypothetical protein
LTPTVASEYLEPMRVPSVHLTACHTCPVPPSMRYSQSPRAGLKWTDPTYCQVDPAESNRACHHCFESAPSCIPRLQPATRFHRRRKVSRVSSDRIIVIQGNMTCAVLFASVRWLFEKRGVLLWTEARSSNSNHPFCNRMHKPIYPLQEWRNGMEKERRCGDRSARRKCHEYSKSVLPSKRSMTTCNIGSRRLTSSPGTPPK